MQDYRQVNLNTLNNGAAAELFQEAWGGVLANIADNNMPSEAVREITIKIRVKPSKDRSTIGTAVAVSAKLASLKPHESFCVLSYDGEVVTAYTTNPKQPELITREGGPAHAEGGRG